MQLCLLLVVTSMTLTACDKDDDDKKASVNNEQPTGGGNSLIGRWELTYDMADGVIDEYYNSGEFIIQFNSDGTYYAIEDGYAESDFWRRQGNTLWIADDDPYTIVELSSSRLVLEYYDSYDYTTWRDVYRRIN